MRRVFLFLIGCALVLALLPAAASAEEGQFRIGLVSEYANYHYGKGGPNAYGTDFGVLLGYEKQVSDSLWYGIDGKYLHGPRRSTFITEWRNTEIRGLAKIGTLFHYGVDIKPFVGVGCNYVDQDQREGLNFYYTDYILPVGVSFEKETDWGLIGADIQGEYVVHREMYSVGQNDTGKTKTFGGNCNLEVGLFYEPQDIPVGFRTYYRYEHANGDAQYGWWGPYNLNTGGFEVYYHF